MNENRLKGLMGLCVRAGQAVFGEESCLKAVRSGQAALMLMDESISESAAEKAEHLCGREGIPARRLPEGLLGDATGKPGTTMAVRPGGFAAQMISCLDEAGQASEKQ